MPVFASILGTLVWVLLGFRLGLDHALDETDPSPAFPTLVVFYLPLAGGSLLVASSLAHLRRRLIAKRRALFGVTVCVVIWTICLAIVLAS